MKLRLVLMAAMLIGNAVSGATVNGTPVSVRSSGAAAGGECGGYVGIQWVILRLRHYALNESLPAGSRGCDRRHRVMVRGLALVGAAAVAAAALWAADLPILQWWNALGDRTVMDARPVNAPATMGVSPNVAPVSATARRQES